MTSIYRLENIRGRADSDAITIGINVWACLPPASTVTGVRHDVVK
jgi:hypothetical protein